MRIGKYGFHQIGNDGAITIVWTDKSIKNEVKIYNMESVLDNLISPMHYEQCAKLFCWAHEGNRSPEVMVIIRAMKNESIPGEMWKGEDLYFWHLQVWTTAYNDVYAIGLLASQVDNYVPNNVKKEF